MNETLTTIHERRAIRSFKPDAVDEHDIEQIIDAGLWAASGMGKQSQIIIAITNKAKRDHIAEINRQIGGWEEGFDPFYGAPVILIVLADKAVPTYIYDGPLALGNMMLAAESLNLGTCWIHRAKEEFEMPEFKEMLDKLGVSGDYEGIGHLALGYPAEPAEAKPRNDKRVFWVR